MNSLVSILLLGASAPATSQSAAALEPRYASAAELRRKLADLHDGIAVERLPTNSKATILIARRDGKGEVETHLRTNDEILAREGKATIWIGSAVTGARSVGEGELRGGAILGVRAFSMAAGDVLWIPAGAPHRIEVPKGIVFTYVTVKVPE